MKRLLTKTVCALALWSGLLLTAGAQTPGGNPVPAEFSLRFEANGHEILPGLPGNAGALDSMERLLDSLTTAPDPRPFTVSVFTGTSPEGASDKNSELSRARLSSVQDYLTRRFPALDRSAVSGEAVGIDWKGLEAALERQDYPWKDEALLLIRTTPVWVTDETGTVVDSRKRRLMNLHGGKAWWTMLEDLFPALRRAVVTVTYEKAPAPQPAPEVLPVTTEQPPVTEEVQEEEPRPVEEPRTALPDTLIAEVTPPEQPAVKRKGGFVLYTNALYDLCLVPNIGTQLYLGSGMALNARWGYAWWSYDARNIFWRIYGGELTLRKYFSRPADDGSGAFRSSVGHHLGVYGQVMTYDFELGKEGQIAGENNKNIFHNPSYGAGLEYGYTLPLGRHLNLDFSVGAGYLGGVVIDYSPSEDFPGEFICSPARRRDKFTLTRADISLYWLIGFGNPRTHKR